MTRIHFAADHGGYELGRALEARARAAGHDVVWHGAEALDPGDDYPIFAVTVGKSVVTDQDAGVDAFIWAGDRCANGQVEVARFKCYARRGSTPWAVDE